MGTQPFLSRCLAGLRSAPSLLSSSPFWHQGVGISHSPQTPPKTGFCLVRFGAFGALCSLFALFICLLIRGPAPLALLAGQAGHVEYPALTWHIRSDDRDGLPARSGRGYFKKEGKRERAKEGV